jgi:hypothetical protein
VSAEHRPPVAAVESAQAEPVDCALQRVIGMRVVPLGAPRDFHNIHFRASTAAGTAVFVKVFDDQGYWRRARAAAAMETLLRTPRLLDQGELGIDRWWISYEWVELRPFVPTAEHLCQVGAMLGRFHASTCGLTAGFGEHDLDAEIADHARRLADLDACAADRVRALHTRWRPTELLDDVGLIHGDFHWRNVALAGGEPMLFDLENMRAAAPLLDFGKLVDLDGLASDADRAAFFRGYERYAPPPVWPWPAALRSVRLWTTAGVLVYSLALGLREFARHGYRRLAELEAERESPGR